MLYGVVSAIIESASVIWSYECYNRVTSVIMEL